jgi:hypothetical protein
VGRCVAATEAISLNRFSNAILNTFRDAFNFLPLKAHIQWDGGKENGKPQARNAKTALRRF